MRFGLKGVIVAGIFIFGGAIGYFVAYRYLQGSIPPAPTYFRANSTEYRFTNPLIFLRTSKSFFADELQGLNRTITNEIAADLKSGRASQASFYYQDLNSAHWTGVNEDLKYKPSSMLKVMIMMAVLKLSERQQSILTKELRYTPHADPTQHYKPEDILKAGYHSTDSLIVAMIEESDNDAADALMSDSGIAAEFTRMYSLFRLPSLASSSPTIGDFMSPRAYSLLFRSLYNSSLFQWDLSEKILGLLSETNFNNGIVAGVPKGLTIAHKFGENLTTDAAGSIIELHDCGIVYYPENPYFICIMTKGHNYNDLEHVITEMSRTLYDYVNANIQADVS